MSRARRLWSVTPAGGGGAVLILACLALVLGVSCLIPLVFRAMTRVGRQTLTRWLGVEGLLALDNLCMRYGVVR